MSINTVDFARKSKFRWRTRNIKLNAHVSETIAAICRFRRPNGDRLQHDSCIVNARSRIRASSSSSSSVTSRERKATRRSLFGWHPGSGSSESVSAHRIAPLFLLRSGDASHWVMPYKYLWGSLVPKRTQFFVGIATSNWNSISHEAPSGISVNLCIYSLSIVSDGDEKWRTCNTFIQVTCALPRMIAHL